MSDRVLVLDASPLNHFARAGELDALRKITGRHDCVTTRAVLGELEHGAARDQVACNVARSRGVTVHRTLRLVVTALKAGELTEAAAQDLVRSLADSDARFPGAARDDLLEWARSHQLL